MGSACVHAFFEVVQFHVIMYIICCIISVTWIEKRLSSYTCTVLLLNFSQINAVLFQVFGCTQTANKIVFL